MRGILTRLFALVALASATVVSACGSGGDHAAGPDASEGAAGTVFRAAAAVRPSHIVVSGVAQPLQEATLSTRLMGSVTAVLVHEGDRVQAGQTLVRLDARELAAKAEQVEAAYAAADAVHREAELNAGRMRALYAEEAAPKAQLDAAEAGLDRAVAGLAAARASAAELGALRSYATIAAPFTGTVVRRLVDPGSFASPGAPLMTLQDASRLRITASVAADAARGIARGAVLPGSIEGEPVTATVEGVVPVGSGSMYRVNAIVDNANGLLPAGGSASLQLPTGERETIVIPAAALVRQGDLTGVRLRRADGDVLRWIRVLPVSADSVEVLGGIRNGDEIVVPPAATGG
jgi:RND family efflux transporter MFP subunit